MSHRDAQDRDDLWREWMNVFMWGKQALTSAAASGVFTQESGDD